MPMQGDARPFPKSVQLARGERRYRRKVASAQTWQRIADAKQGPCRVCGGPPPNQLHHLKPRSRGGSDVEANIVPLCARCHAAVTLGDAAALRVLDASLTADERAARAGAASGSGEPQP